MIITKGMEKVSGYIEYSYDYKDNPDITDDDRESMFESDTFHSLEELLEKLQPSVLEEIKDSYDADVVWVSAISFKGESEDKETKSEISMFSGKASRGHVATTIHNEDINNRLLLNLQHVKSIIDNTLEQYPVKYSR